MKLIEKIKEYINSKNEVVDDSENIKFLYQSILDELMKYKELYFEEAKKLKGHPHFKTKEVQEKVINLINEDERVLFIRGDWGRTLGFEAAELKLEDVVLRVLDNYDASLFQDDNGKNIGMESASYGLHKATLKALDNDELSCQTMNNSDWNIGMFCAIHEFEEGVIKSLDNKEASLQQSISGQNIGMLAAEYGLNKATMKALDNYEASIQQDNKGNNIGMWSVANCDEEVTLKALDNKEASVQLGGKGYEYNIGMLCAERGLEKATLKALDNPKASIQQNMANMNIGMICAVRHFEEGVIKALDNEVARKQQSKIYKENMSMLAAKNKMLKAVSKSLDFKDVRQQDIGDNTHTRLKQYIFAYIDDEEIIEKSNRLYHQDLEDFLAEVERETGEEETIEIESAEIDS